MIPGLRDPDSESELFARQVGFMVARLAFRQHILEQAVHALFLFDPPKTQDERANAKHSLELSLMDADDPGKVEAWAAQHWVEVLPPSMR